MKINSYFSKSKIQTLEIITLFVLILGVAISVGIPTTALSMRHTAQMFMTSSKALNFEYRHTLGIDIEMVDELAVITKSEAYGVIDADTYIKLDGRELVSRIIAINEVTLNDLTLSDGSFPLENGEIVIDAQMAQEQGIEIGDTLESVVNEAYDSTTMKVVGLVSSNLYLTKDRGVSKLGTGTVDGFIYGKGLPTRTNLFTSVRFNSTQDQELKALLTQNESLVTENRLKRISSPLIQEIQLKQSELNDEIERSNQIYDAIKNELAMTQLELQDAHSEVESAIGEIAADFELNFGPQSLQAKHDTLLRVVEDLKNNQTQDLQLSNTKIVEELKVAQDKLKELDNLISVTTDETTLKPLHEEKKVLDDAILVLEGELEISSNDLLESIQNGEAYTNELKRIQQGINSYNDDLKNYQIRYSAYLKESDANNSSFKKRQDLLDLELLEITELDKGKGIIKNRDAVIIGYLEYLDDTDRMDQVGTILPFLIFICAALLSFTSARNVKGKTLSQVKINPLMFVVSLLIGLILAYSLVPQLIYSIYQTVYQTPDLQIVIKPIVILVPIILSIGSTAIVYFLSRNYFKHKKLAINRKIIVERFTKIWKKIPILNRLRMRNLSRIKIAFILIAATLGIVLSLLIASIDAKIEISNVVSNQNKSIFHFDGIMNVSDNFKNHDTSIKETLTLTIKRTSVESKKVTLYIFSDSKDNSEWISLNKVNGDPVSLNDNSVVITENLAKDLGISLGHSIMLNLDGKDVSFVVGEISENQLTHSIFLTKKYAQSVMKQTIDINSALYKLEDKNVNDSFSKVSGLYNYQESSKILSSTIDISKSYETFLIFPIVVSIVLLVALLYAITLLGVEFRRKDIITFVRLGKSRDFIWKEIFRDIFVMIAAAHMIGILISNIFYEYLITTSLGSIIIVNSSVNVARAILITLISLSVNSLVVCFFLRRIVNKKTPISNR